MAGMYSLAHIALLVLVHVLQMTPSYQAPVSPAINCDIISGATLETNNDYSIVARTIRDEEEVEIYVTASNDAVPFLGVWIQVIDGNNNIVGEFEVDEDQHLSNFTCPSSSATIFSTSQANSAVSEMVLEFEHTVDVETTFTIQAQLIVLVDGELNEYKFIQKSLPLTLLPSTAVDSMSEEDSESDSDSGSNSS